MTFEQSLRRADPLAPIGIASVAVATGGAVVLVPDKFWLPGALWNSAAVLAIGLLGPLTAEIVRRPRTMFRADYLLLAGLVYWVLLDLLQSQNEPTSVPIDVVRAGFVAIGLFAVGLWSAALVPPWRLPRAVARAAGASPSNGMLVGGLAICFVLGMGHYVLSCNFDFGLMFSSLLQGRWSAPWAGSNLGGWGAFQSHLPYFGYLVPTLTVLIAHRSGWLSGGAIAGVLCSLLVFAFAAQSGTRNEFGVIIGACFLSWLLLQPRIDIRVMIITAVFVVTLLAWFQVMLAARNVGFGALIEGNVADNINTTSLNVDDNFNRLCQVIDLIPSRVDHSMGGQFFYVAVRPIPRAIWPGKPVGPGFSFEEEIGETYATWSVSVIGEFYYDFGYVSVFLGGLLYGRLAGMWNQLLATRRGLAWPLLYGLGAMALFVGIRSQQAFAVRVYPILFWLVLDYLFLRDAGAVAATPMAPVTARKKLA